MISQRVSGRDPETGAAVTEADPVAIADAVAGDTDPRVVEVLG